MMEKMDGSVKKPHLKRAYLLAGCAAVLLIVAGCLWFQANGNSGGATVGNYDGKSRAEIQAELDRQVRDSMMTISLDMTPTLSQDGKRLRVRVANDKSNRFDQKFEVEQDGKVVASFKGLEPGEKVDEVDCEGAHAGAATVTVWPQDGKTGEVSGNPSGFEVEIVESE